MASCVTFTCSSLKIAYKTTSDSRPDHFLAAADLDPARTKNRKDNQLNTSHNANKPTFNVLISLKLVSFRMTSPISQLGISSNDSEDYDSGGNLLVSL